MSVILKVPTHLDGRNPLVGRYTAREIVPIVIGIFGAAGVMTQPHPAALTRAGEALTLLLIGSLTGLVRPGGRSLVAWGRLAVSHLLTARSAAWAPPVVLAPAASNASARRPPHLVLATNPDTGRLVQAPSAKPQDASTTPRAARRPATQHHPFIPTEIVDDTIVFADGHRCAVLECSGANIDAMDADQKRALHAAYHAFLLGLVFPLQVLICADPVDLDSYATRRTERLAGRSLAVRRLGSADTAYMRRAMARLGGLDQHVYVVIPAAVPSALPVSSGGSLLAYARHHRRLATARRVRHPMDMPAGTEADQLLAERCAAVREGLAGVGVHAWRLDTPTMRELYYRRLCPRAARLQPLDRGNMTPAMTARVLFDQSLHIAADEEENDA